MTLKAFIQQIPLVMLQRGQNYFDQGNLTGLTQNERGEWYAEIAGNYGDYAVKIQLDKEDQVLKYQCNCPFEGSICKHIAAVALAIDGKSDNYQQVNEADQIDNWSLLIKEAQPEELRNFMIEFGLKNHDFRHQVKLKFSKPDLAENIDNTSYYQRQINDVFNHYDHHGYIDYSNGFKVIDEISHFQRKLDDYYAKGNLNEAFSIAAAIIIEAVKAIQNMDDSSGACSGTIQESFESIKNILNATNSSQLKKNIFDWLFEQVQNEDYNDYGLGDNLEPLFFETAASLKQLDKAYQFINDKMKILDKTDGWSKKYYSEVYLTYQINLLQSEGKMDEAQSIIDSHLRYAEIRQLKVNGAIQEKNFKNAEELIIKGIEIGYQEKLEGIVHQWKDQLLKLYDQQNESFKYNSLARELFIENTSDVQYFRAFKKSSHGQDWTEQRNRLIAELKSLNKGYQIGIPLYDLAQVYIEEQMIKELFELVSSSNNIYSIVKYTDLLKEEYSAELLKLYKTEIEKEAVQTGRHVYTSIVTHLIKMSKLKDGKSAARELKRALLEEYKNRPAMKEEFRKLNW